MSLATMTYHIESADLDTVLLAFTATERLRLGLTFAVLDTMLRLQIAMFLLLSSFQASVCHRE